MAVCNAIECYLDQLPPESEIILTSMTDAGKKGICIECQNLSVDNKELCKILENSTTWQDLKEIMAAIDGDVEHLESKPGLMLFFT
jgi:hypothetical protein